MLESIKKSKLKSLDESKKILKTKLFGIDTVIDQVVDSIRSWYVFPEFQTRPLIINLWGMTGVGKTELVKSLIEILDLQNQFSSIDCGELKTKGTETIKNILSNLSERNSSEPTILLFDEFQLARTISRDGEELSFPESRALWQLLDNGIITSHREWYYHDKRINDLIVELSYWIKQGAVISQGLISEKDSDFLKAKKKEKWTGLCPSDWEKFISNPKNRFVLNHDDLFILEEATKFKYGDFSLLEFRIKELDGEGILNFLKELNEEVLKPTILDFSKALIFVVGNLDEVYRDSKDFSPDISPEIFYDNSKKITYSEVKKALLRRFRAEQIARLGNNHIIYPALNFKAYMVVIDQKLKKLSSQIKTKTGIEIEFEESISDWVFQEGVIPTQGIRPVLSTIRYGIEDQIPKILLDAMSIPVTISLISIKYCNAQIKACFWNSYEIIQEVNYPISEKTKSLKNTRKDDLQATTAVHESGHAILIIDQLGIFPTQVLSVASESGVGGLINFKTDKFLSLEYLRKRVAILLGGFEAENLVFGRDMVSDGSSDDIQRATEMTISLFKNSGFGTDQLQFAECHGEYKSCIHEFRDIEMEAKELITESRTRAQSILRREKKLLLEMAAILADFSTLSTEEIAKLVEQNGTDDLKQSINSKKFTPRSILLEAIENERSSK